MNLSALLPAAKTGSTAIANQAPAAISGMPTLGASNPNATPLDQVISGIAASQPTAAATPATTPMAFDPQYEATKNQINAGLAGLQSTSDLNKQRTNEDYDTAVGTATKNQTQNLSALQNRLANQGIGYSGINVSEQGRLGEDYQTQLGALAQGKQRTLEDITRDFTGKQTDYQNQLAQAEIDRGTRETTRQNELAATQAAAEAAKTTADTQRQWMTNLTSTLTSLVQPTPTPTGQMALPPTNPTAVVQKALQAVPPPAAKTPQQQIQESGIDPKALQQTLTTLGYSPGPIDGIIGIKSQQALARLKQSLGLPATADMTPEIWTQIQSVLNARNSASSNITAGLKPITAGPVTSPQQLANNINNRIVTGGYNAPRIF